MAELKDLKLDEHNFNAHTEEGIQMLQKSIEQNGFGRSVLVDGKNNIIAGNGIVQAARKAGKKKIVFVDTDGDTLVVARRKDLDLDTKEGREMAMADNATAELHWNEEQLKYAREAFGVKLENWVLPQVKQEPETKKVSEDDFDETKAIIPKVSKKGDIFKLGEHRLMCGDSADSIDVAALMDGEKADMVFTDPPYGVAIGDKNKTLKEKVSNGRGNAIVENIENDAVPLDQLYKILVSAMTNCRLNCKDDAAYFVTSPQGGDLGMMMMMMMKDAGLPVRHILIWAKNNPTFSLGRLDYDYQHEPIFYTWTKKRHNYRGGQFRSTIWNIDRLQKCDLHPTMKPVPLVANCLLDCTKESDIVLDLFGGSGTTMIAAEQLGRKARLMELDPHYCDVIIARWENLTGKKAELLNP